MNDVADHCTVCHKCMNPCPVDIDFGAVTTRMRRILVDRGKKRFSPGTWAAMQFLNATDPRTVAALRTGLGKWGFAALSVGHDVVRRLGLLGRGDAPPAATTGAPAVRTQVVEMLRRPLRVELPRKLYRAELGLEDPRHVPILRDPDKAGEEAEALFYFPGCGSERLFGDIGLATIAMLLDTGAQVVLPPGYLCCGYPQTAAGQHAQGNRITMENRVLFHRVANTLNYLDIKTVVVSCGTCMDQLLNYEFQQIFPGCRLLDVHEYLMEKGVRLEETGGVKYLYHDPCHTPMKTHAPLQVAKSLLGAEVRLSERCCGEAGTLGTSRPDIANQLRFRKQEELVKGIHALAGTDRADGAVRLVTACPACQQGLSRYADDTGLKTDYIVVELAKARLGDGWQQRFVERIRERGIEQVLL
jgi:Fe-S oxidoreductase